MIVSSNKAFVAVSDRTTVLDQGTTPELSKVWMPLDEFTPLAMGGLKRGDMQIPIGMAKLQYNKFEDGKVEMINKIFASFKK